MCLRIPEFMPLPISRNKLISFFLGGGRLEKCPPAKKKSSWDLKIRYIICATCASRSQNLCSYPSSAISNWSLEGWRNGSPKSLCKFQNILHNLCLICTICAPWSPNLCPLPSAATSEARGGGGDKNFITQNLLSMNVYYTRFLT